MGNFFRDLDRKVFRPVGRAFGSAKDFLDKNVPGWTVVAGALTPVLPIAPLIAAAIAAASTSAGVIGAAAVQFAGNTAGFLLPEGILPSTPGVYQPLQIQLPTGLQKEMVSAYQQAAEGWVKQGSDALAPLRYTLAKAIEKYETEGGPLEQHLEALGVEIAQGVALYIEIGLTVITLGTAAGFFAPATVTGALVEVATPVGTQLLATAPTAAGTVAEVPLIGGGSAIVAVAPGASSAVLPAAAVLAIKSTQLALQGALAGERVYRAKQVADATRSAARKVAAAKLAEARALDAEAARLEAELASLRRARVQRAATAEATAERQRAEAETARVAGEDALGKTVALVVGAALVAEVLG